jgi:hypothetical protein
MYRLRRNGFRPQQRYIISFPPELATQTLSIQFFMLTISARIGNVVYAPGSTSLDENFADVMLAKQKPPLLASDLSHSFVQLFVRRQFATTAKFVKVVDSL